jgi:hypothetical protein
MSEYITYDWYYDSRARKISSVIKNRDDIVGEFSLILGKTGRMSSGGYPPQLYVDVDEKYQGRGYSNILLKNFHDFVYYSWNSSQEMYILTDNNRASRPYTQFDKNVMLYIDSDASMNSRGSSFWRKIGMMPVGEYDEYNGYELSISLKDLLTKISNKKCTAPKRKNSKSKRGGRRKDSKDSKDIKHNKDIKYIKEINV